VTTPSAPRLSGRERNKLATRRALRAAILDLGLERGWGEVRVEEVAERAGVSTRTFFNYFDTKEDAALLDVLTLGDDALTGLAGSAEPEAALWGQWAALFAADAERVGADGPEFSRRMELQGRSPELRSRQMGEFVRFEARLSAAIAARLPDDEAGRLRAGVMSGSCITAVRVGLERWADAGWHGSPRPHVEAAFALLAPAFAARG
jgi:AcrR family transcriptional regulator